MLRNRLAPGSDREAKAEAMRSKREGEGEESDDGRKWKTCLVADGRSDMFRSGPRVPAFHVDYLPGTAAQAFRSFSSGSSRSSVPTRRAFYPW